MSDQSKSLNTSVNTSLLVKMRLKFGSFWSHLGWGWCERKMSSLNFWVQKVTSVKFGGSRNLRLSWINCTLFQKVQTFSKICFLMKCAILVRCWSGNIHFLIDKISQGLKFKILWKCSKRFCWGAQELGSFVHGKEWDW